MESIIFTTDAGMVLAELLDGTQHEDIFIVADKHTVLFCDRLFETVAPLARDRSGLRGRE